MFHFPNTENLGGQIGAKFLVIKTYNELLKCSCNR